MKKERLSHWIRKLKMKKPNKPIIRSLSRVLFHCSQKGKTKLIFFIRFDDYIELMDLIEASRKEEGKHHVHGWENVTLEEVMATAVQKTKLTAV